MNFTLLIAYLFSILLLIITPGPVMALIINVTSNNKKNIISTICGTNIASLIYISIASLSIAGILNINDNFINILSLLGSIFIGYLSIRIILGYFNKKNSTSEDIKNRKISGGFLVGFLVAIANPKDIIFFISFFPQFILITQSFYLSITTLAICWIVMDFLILYFCSFLMQKQTTKIKGLIELTSGLLLLLVAIVSLYFNFSNFSGNFL